jgi:hypothetical protein
MKNPWMRATGFAVLGALAGAAALLAAFNIHPQIVFDMDRDQPGRALSGTYPVEINGDESFAWTSDRAVLNVQGVDRRMPWTCEAEFRGGRSPGQPQPDVSLVLDNQVLAARKATNDYESLRAVVPARSQRGLRLTLTSSTTFVPGPSDPRALGVQLDRLACAPEAGRLVLPPVDALGTAAATAGIFGALFAIVGLSLVTSAGLVLALAAVQAVPLSMGLGPYMPYVDRSLWAAIWIAIAAAGGVLLVSRSRTLSTGARLAVAFSAAALFVKLLALLHPSKTMVDALFHAHRLDYVLGGRYFFTQVMPGGVQFPYSIALYVFAAPWAAITRDHVALLRVVVSASEAVAGVLLYWAVARRWKDAAAAVLAVVAFHLLPVSFWVIGNANLTNAFGQQAALAAMAGLIAWRLDTRDWIQVLALSALAALAMLAHVSSAALLAGTMLITAVVVRLGGGKAEMPAARSMGLAAVIAIIASIAVYYGRPEFYAAYRSVQGTQAGGVGTPMSIGERIQSALLLSGDAVGWPILALAVLGAWRVWAEPSRDRVTWTLAGWLLTTGAFVVFGIFAPIGGGHHRYAMEFVARAVYAGAPAVLVLAGVGGVWAWRAGASFRFVVIFLLTVSVFVASSAWFNWIR